MKKIAALIILLTGFASGTHAQDTSGYGKSFAPLVKEVIPAVVNISTVYNTPQATEKLDIISANQTIREYFLQDEGGHTSLGSGFIIDSKGYIITNHHVIDGADEIIVKLSDNRQFNASIKGFDEMTDLALIKIEANDVLPFAKIGDSDKLEVGDWILAVGNPFGLGGSVTAGIVSAKSRDIDAGSYDNFIQTDAAINQGSSGGPMFNMQGEVVGVNTAIFSSTGGSMGIGFATPINLSKFVVEQLMLKGRVERGWLGLKVSTNSQAIVISDNQTFKEGVIVSAISEESPASEAEMEAGDVVISINGKDVKDAKSFSRYVAETPIGSNIILRVWRNGQIKDINLTIKSMPERKKNITDNKVAIKLESETPNGYVDTLGIIVSEDGGVVSVNEVLADSDAHFQGLKAGDIIQKINGNDVKGIDDVKAYSGYAQTNGDDTVELKILSEQTPKNLRIRINNDD